MKRFHIPVAFSACLASLPAATVLNIASVSGFEDGDNATGDGSIGQLISGAGLTKTDPNDVATWTHNTRWQDGWQGNGFNNSAPDPIGWVVIDLGSAITNLQNLYLWNANESGGTATDRGVQSYRIYLSNSPAVPPPAATNSATDYNFGSGGWTILGGDRTLAKGPALDTYTFGDVIDLTGVASARYVGFEFQSNYGATSPARIGLAEIVVTTVPEPSVLLVSCVGMVAAACRRRR